MMQFPFLKNRLLLLLLLLCPLFVMGQESKKVKALKRQKTELQKSLKKSQQDLQTTKKQVKTGQQDLQEIGKQLEDRVAHIHKLEGEIDQLAVRIEKLQADIARMNRRLQEKKERFRMSVRYMRNHRQKTSPLLFVLSSETFMQMFRRARYAKDYAVYQKNLGEQILQRQVEVLEAQNKLLDAKSRMNTLLQEVMKQRKELNMQQIQKQKDVDGLKKKEKGLAGKVADQQKQLASLDKQIDALIAYEIEQARKRAEEAARKKAAAQKKQNKGKTGETAKKETPSKSPVPKDSKSWLTAQDRKLNGSFVQNKGRLPVPITGPYMIGNHFGTYQVSGLKNVRLDNKGTNFVGQAGARARCVFDGQVTAVFQFGGTQNVLIRHGSYISVYCNLSSVTVRKGETVSARDIVGTVANDGQGNYVLHFQLRKETAKLNPEHWIGR